MLTRAWRWLRPRLQPIKTALAVRDLALEEAAQLADEVARWRTQPEARGAQLVARLIRERKIERSAGVQVA